MRLFNPYANESDLLAGCKAGHAAAQNWLYKQYNRKLFAICLRYADRRETAEDILQETFIKIFQKIGQFNGQGSLEGWMKRIAVRTALDFYRQSLRQIETHELYPEAGESAEIDYPADIEVLTQSIQALPAGCRTVFNLFAVEGYSHKEIAEMLQVSEGSSRSQLAYARKKLMEQFNVQSYVRQS